MQNCSDMIDEQYDYYQYALSIGSLSALEQLMEVQNDKIHQYRHVPKIAILLCRLGVKLTKISKSELQAIQSNFDAYVESDEYSSLLKKESEQGEDNYRAKVDTDPSGLVQYHDVVSYCFY